VWIRVHYNG